MGIAARMHLSIHGLVSVLLDALFGREIHRAAPVAEVVDHRQAAASAGLAGRCLLAGEIHSLLSPLDSTGVVAVSARLFLERIRHAALLRTSLLLLFGKRHDGPPVVSVGGSAENVGMPHLYTKNGRPLQRDGDRLFAGSGTYLGTIQGRYVFDTSGQYAGTVDGDRVVYRVVDSARISSPTIAAPRVGIAVMNAVPAAILGEEPTFPN